MNHLADLELLIQALVMQKKEHPSTKFIILSVSAGMLYLEELAFLQELGLKPVILLYW